MVKQLGFMFLLLVLGTQLHAQSIISYATLNKKQAYIGEPVQLTVSVYTSTWFTSGVDVGNIQIDGALTVYFRSLSNSRTFNGKKYSGVSFYYNLFPNKTGELIIPSLSINVESPKPDNYKGIKHAVKTKPETLKVNDIPMGYDPNSWLVSNGLTVQQKWSTPLTKVKVGDVVQRTITRSAGGTLSEFIPSTAWDSIPGISIYPKRATVNTTKAKTYVSASRTETVNYLFEKEGNVLIPGTTYTYWNPGSQVFYTKTLDAVPITVAPNPDLEMLASIKKSLQKTVEAEVEQEEKPFTILGLSAKNFSIYVLTGLLFLFVVYKLTKRLLRWIKLKRLQYLNSEKYAFKQALSALKQHDSGQFLIKSRIWIKTLDSRYETLSSFAQKFNFENLNDALLKYNQDAFQKKTSANTKVIVHLKNALVQSRKVYLLQDEKIKPNNNKWLNPTAID
ncbi:BatD family protein [Tamlana fucoidanivorans]|uniref:Protein BatD n=1 Tax=Allotamlana fucoidanivorans TaxID=2583814 RepID=A0A5C4SGN9_9FLAO|nr:BatD family protein [Tamlana fucoidanivorans]TNJ42515.1 protein BatD [Tamlana fucoidanivorans]